MKHLGILAALLVVILCVPASAAATLPAPTNFHKVSATQTSIVAAWNAVAGAGGYRTGENGGAISWTTGLQTTWTQHYTPGVGYGPMSCGTTYHLSIQSSTSSSVSDGGAAFLDASTASCGTPDTQPPTQPGSLTKTGSSTSSLSFSWTASTDNVGVTGYETFLNSTSQGTQTGLTKTVSGLACGTSYTFGVEARDAAGNHSTRANLTVSTDACPGTLRFRGDFEATEPVRGQWNGAQCDNWGQPDDSTYNFGKLFVVTDVVTKPVKAGRFDLDGDNRATSCEALHTRTLGTGQGYPALDEWYALSFRLSSNYTTQGWGTSIAQFNFQGIWGSPMQLLGMGPNTNPSEPLSVRLIMQAGQCNPVGSPSPGCAYNTGGNPTGGVPIMYAIPNSRFSVGTWHDLLVHVRWTTSLNGLYEVFERTRGGSWAQTVNVSGAFPTVQWRPGGYAHPDQGTHDSIGAYRGGNLTPVSIWHDNFCSGTTRSIVEACL